MVKHLGIVLFVVFITSTPLLMTAGYFEGNDLIKPCSTVEYHEEPDGTLRYDNGTIAGYWTRDPLPLSFIPGMEKAYYYYHVGIEWIHTKLDANYETYVCLES